MATFIDNSTAIIIVAACFGFNLSMDVFGFALQVRDTVSNEKVSKHATMTQWRLKEIIIFVVMLLLTAAIAGVSSHFSSDVSAEMLDAFGFVFVVLLVLLKVLGDVQCVSIFFGLFRNPLYPASIETAGEFKKRKKTLRYVGLLRQTLLYYGEYHCHSIDGTVVKLHVSALTTLKTNCKVLQEFCLPGVLGVILGSLF